MTGSSVGIATDYALDGPGSNPGGYEIFRPSRPVLGPTQPPVKWVIKSKRMLQPGHNCSLPAPNLQPTATQERDDQCGNEHYSRELLMIWA